jgi:hypothetical protein
LQSWGKAIPVALSVTGVPVEIISPPTGTLESNEVYVVPHTAVNVSATPPAAANAVSDDVEAVLLGADWREAETKLRRISVLARLIGVVA